MPTINAVLLPLSSMAYVVLKIEYGGSRIKEAVLCDSLFFI
jgi:hypothetical protein